jgi:hypothetical protein
MFMRRDSAPIDFRIAVNGGVKQGALGSFFFPESAILGPRRFNKRTFWSHSLSNRRRDRVA